MFLKSNRRASLLRYWTTRYLLTLCVGLLIIGISSFYWIQNNANEKRLEFVRLMAEEMADRLEDGDGPFRIDPTASRLLANRQQIMAMDIHPILLFFNKDNQAMFLQPQDKFIAPLVPQVKEMLQGSRDTFTLHADYGRKFSAVKRQIKTDNETVGWIVILYQNQIWHQNREELQFLLVMLSGIALLGWGIIYLLTRKLAEPIRDVAQAAKQIVSGDYRVQFSKDIKAREIHELTESFKDMAERLRQLEMMRTELLAGVTHELKTPVASISGLIQAIRDEVVTGEEAGEFLAICSTETERLQKTVEDLLNFNSFAVGVIHVQKERYNINQMVQEIVYQWQILQDDDAIQVLARLPERSIHAETDAARVQQILYNLLNNAKQAMQGQGNIEVSLLETDSRIVVRVKDEGAGIPAEEQDMIFERFFRGSAKKSKVRGLGLGLTFSRMLAKALDGDLDLVESSSAGSTFALSLRK